MTTCPSLRFRKIEMPVRENAEVRAIRIEAYSGRNLVGAITITQRLSMDATDHSVPPGMPYVSRSDVWGPRRVIDVSVPATYLWPLIVTVRTNG